MSPLTDIAELAQVNRRSTAFLFVAKVWADSRLIAHVRIPFDIKSRGVCRHLIRLTDMHRPGDTLSLTTTVPSIVAVNPNTLRPETAEELHADPRINPNSIPDDPAPPHKRHRSATHSETPWDPFALVPAAASLPTALVQYHRERCGADFDRFVSCLRTEALVDAVLDRERAQTDRERAQTDRERAQTAVAEEQLRQLCRTAENIL